MDKELNEKIIEINNLLIERFGIPPKNKRKPDPLDLLIATILSQNTNDKNSYKAFRQLKNEFPDYSLVKKAPLTKIKNAIKVAGLAEQKAKAIQNLIANLPGNNSSSPTLNFIKKMSNEEILSYLTNFKGIGVKTASCVLLFSLRRNVCPVDTHVHRTLNRMGAVQTKNPVATFEIINKNFPEGIAHSFHTNLIRLGREICLSNRPKCNLCPCRRICKFNEKNFSNSAEPQPKEFMLLDNV